MTERNPSSNSTDNLMALADTVEALFGSEVAVIVALVRQAGGIAIFQAGKEVNDPRMLASALRALAERLERGEPPNSREVVPQRAPH